MAETTHLEKRRIQMEYVVPLVKDLMEVLGEATVIDALEEINQRRLDRTEQGHNPDFARMSAAVDVFAAGDALDYDLIASSSDRFDIDIRRCGYAEMMEELGGREFGHLLICAADFVDARKQGMDLQRTQTRMQGGSHCDFRYARAAVAEDSQT